MHIFKIKKKLFKYTVIPLIILIIIFSDFISLLPPILRNSKIEEGLKIQEAKAATSGEMTLYFHKEPSSANETYNSFGFAPPEPAAYTSSALTSTANVNATPPTSFCESSNNTGETFNQVGASAATTGNRCIGTFISPPVGQAFTMSTTDAAAVAGAIWSSESNTAVTAATNIYLYRWNGSGTSVVSTDRIATFTGADPGTAATLSSFAAVAPANNITFAATDRIVAIVSMNVTVASSSRTVSVYFDNSAAATQSNVTLKYTAITPNKPALSGAKDDDFTTDAATTACSTAGVVYNAKWTCLQGTTANTSGSFNAGGTGAAPLGDSSNWLWLRNQTTATSAVPSDFGAIPSNTFLYQSLNSGYGDGLVRTVVNSSLTYTIGVANPTTPFNHSGLVLWTSNSDYLEIQVYSDAAKGVANSAKVVLNNSGVFGTPVGINNTVSNGLYNRVWLGFQNTGGNYQAQYSTDGATWINLGSPVVHSAFVRTGLNAFTGLNSPISSYAGAFEWFQHTFAPPVAATLTVGVTAGSEAAVLNSGGTSQYVNSAGCATPATCAAFTLSLSSGSETVTSIKITETGTADATNNLSNLNLYYDTTGTNGAKIIYGTAASFVAEAATVTGSLAISAGTTYYFYVQVDLLKSGTYPKGGQTMDFQIAANGDIGTSGSPTKTGAPVNLAGSTVVLPTATSISYQAPLADGARSGYNATVSGYGFGAALSGSRANCAGAVDTGCVRFTVGGNATVADADFTVWTNTSISFNVNASLASYGGASAVQITAGSQNAAANLTFYIYPNIASTSANSGQIGSLIAVSGDHFGASSGSAAVNAKTVVVSPGTWFETSVSVFVPGQEGAANIVGKIQLTRAGDSRTSNQYPANPSNFTILAPSVSGSSPGSATTGQTLTIQFSGLGIDTDTGTAPILKLTKAGQTEIVGTAYVKITGYQTVSASFNLTGAVIGYWKLAVVNMDTQSGSFGNESTTGFYVSAPAPTVTGITPGFGADSGIINITSVAGTNFQNGATVRLTKTAQADITPSTAFSYTSPTALSNGAFNLAGQANGWWNVVVANPDSQTGSYGNEINTGFEIRSAKPSAPANVYQFKNNTDSAQPPTVNIAVGGGIGGQTTVYFRMDMSGGLSGTYYPQVEIKPVGAAFECTNGGPSPCSVTSGFFVEGPGVVYGGAAVQGWASVNGIDGTSYHWQARVRNSAGTGSWVSFGGNTDPNDIDVYLDNTSPAISPGTDGTCATAAVNISDLGATIKWNTTDATSGAQFPPGPGSYATAQVQYVKTSQFTDWVLTPGLLSAANPRENSPHQIALNGLFPSMSYTYRMRSQDALGNETLSANCTFTTLATRPLKTVEFFIDQETAQNTGVQITKSFSIYVPESPGVAGGISVRSAFIEITGITGATPNQTINVELKRGAGAYVAPGANYTIDSTGAVTPFTVFFDALNPPGTGQDDMSDITTGASAYSYTLYLNGGGTSVSAFSAKLILTYTYVL